MSGIRRRRHASEEAPGDFQPGFGTGHDQGQNAGPGVGQAVADRSEHDREIEQLLSTSPDGESGEDLAKLLESKRMGPPSKLTLALVAILLIGIGFLGGVYVQRTWGPAGGGSSDFYPGDAPMPVDSGPGVVIKGG